MKYTEVNLTRISICVNNLKRHPNVWQKLTKLEKSLVKKILNYEQTN